MTATNGNKSKQFINKLYSFRPAAVSDALEYFSNTAHHTQQQQQSQTTTTTTIKKQPRISTTTNHTPPTPHHTRPSKLFTFLFKPHPTGLCSRFMVPSIHVHGIGVEQMKRQQRHEHFHPGRSTVDKIPVEQVSIGGRRQPVDGKDGE